MSEPAVFQIATDGSCLGNPGPGGWAAVFEEGNGAHRVVSGNENHTTNNRMELKAAIVAVERLPEGAQAVITTDSQYVKNGITEWLPSWKRKNWRTADKKPVKNRDLWERLDAATSKRTIRWEWVRGHSGHPLNDLADAEALAQAEAARDTLSVG